MTRRWILICGVKKGKKAGTKLPLLKIISKPVLVPKKSCEIKGQTQNTPQWLKSPLPLCISQRVILVEGTALIIKQWSHRGCLTTNIYLSLSLLFKILTTLDTSCQKFTHLSCTSKSVWCPTFELIFYNTQKLLTNVFFSCGLHDMMTHSLVGGR